MKKSLDAGSEVSELRAAVEGVRVLLDMLVNESAPDAATGRAVPRSASALLNLVGARLMAFGQALNGSRDPAELVQDFNHALGDGGTVVRAWNSERRKSEVQRELRRLQHERPRRRR